MSNLPPPWDLYFARQTELLNSTTVDDLSWGREAKLNWILAGESAPEVIDRTGRSVGRRERYQAGLRRQHLAGAAATGQGEEALQARERLRAVKAAVNDEELLLLGEVAEGIGYEALAALRGTTAGALRARMLRLRHRLAVLAA